VNIIAYQTGHDSSVVGISNGGLVASIEGEKDSKPRFYMQPTLDNAFDWLDRLNRIQDFDPDVICILGFNSSDGKDRAGHYFGLNYKETECRSIFGKKVNFFYSTHEKAHIFLSYALSPFPQGRPVYCLSWEGSISALYEIDENLNISKLSDVIPFLGSKYSFLYVLAGAADMVNLDSAGKIMALASFSAARNPDMYKDVIDYLLFNIEFREFTPNECASIKRALVRKFGHKLPVDQGVLNEGFLDLCWAFQERVLEIFFEVANGLEKLPLLISGGCGLNCYWNQRIKESGLFEDVFVPPCANDSGVAIGLAAEAQLHYTGNAKIEWSVYAGEPFRDQSVDTRGFIEKPLSYQDVAEFLDNDHVVAWIQGRYEIGPRALCNRSLLASPFSGEMHQRLNQIKNRESYRPIAPVCLEEDAKEIFGLESPSPHMLYFSQVATPALQAVTHVDNSARVQTVSLSQNEAIYRLLQNFKKITGFGVLCNTSLNFNRKGFINNTRDAFRYVRERGLDGIVIGERFYEKSSPDNVTPVGMSTLQWYDSETDSLHSPEFEITNKPADYPAIKSLELQDWSMYRFLELDLYFRSLSHVGSFSEISIYADHLGGKVMLKRATNKRKILNGATERLLFTLDKADYAKSLLDGVTNIRFVVCAELSSRARIRISNIKFIR
jgi:hydroxymethyl cephem carbamoyltransferase